MQVGERKGRERRAPINILWMDGRYRADDRPWICDIEMPERDSRGFRKVAYGGHLALVQS
jgi:hypothetical protein